MPRYNPFRPNGLVPPAVFTGRIEETFALDKILYNTLHGNPQHFVFYGERGIGKSSLLYIHQLTAAGTIPPYEGDRFNFLVVSVTLEPTDTHESIIRKLGSGLRATCANQAKGKELLRKSWLFLSRFEAAGIKLREAKGELEQDPQGALADAYCKVCEDIKGFYDGVQILIDEADTAPSSAHLGGTLKTLTERVSYCSNCVLTVGLAGVSNLIPILRESHASAPRLFTGFHLKPLTPEESRHVIRKALDEAAEKNKRKTKIDRAAENYIVELSEGYPSFIQEFGYASFDADTDWDITMRDVEVGAWKEHGAYAQLGMKYFKHLVGKISSDDYRLVLKVMAEHGDSWMTKETIRQEAGLKESTLTNALSTLLSRQIIYKEGKRGQYKLPSKSFAAWLKGLQRLQSESEPE